MTLLQIILIILLCTIIAFLSGKISSSIVSAGIVLALVLTGVMRPARALSDFTSANMVMFIAMFVIGVALTKTSLLDGTQKLVARYKNNPKVLVLISSLVAGFLVCPTSATATATIMISLPVGIVNEIGISRSEMPFLVMTTTNVATAMTFLEQGVNDMAWNNAMIKAGTSTPLSIWDFTIARTPTLLIPLVYMIFIGYRFMPDIGNSQFSDDIWKKDTVSQLVFPKEKVAIILILDTITCTLLESVIGIKMYLAASIGTCLLVPCDVLSERGALGSIHQSIVFLFTGVLVFSDTIKITGAGDVVAGWMISLLGNTINPYVIMAVFFTISFILTQAVSNLAAVIILIPLVAATRVETGVDPRVAVMGVFIASPTSILTPVAAPCRIMIVGPGGYSLKGYLKCGVPLAVMTTTACIFTLPIMLPFY